MTKPLTEQFAGLHEEVQAALFTCLDRVLDMSQTEKNNVAALINHLVKSLRANEHLDDDLIERTVRVLQADTNLLFIASRAAAGAFDDE